MNKPAPLPLLPTHVIGSYAWPGWYHCCHACVRRGEFGPIDLEELQNDAVDLAIRDQEEAGLDVISDGEMRRAGFFTAAFYGFIPGLEPVPPARLLGATSHDQQHRFRATRPFTVPAGFGTTQEFGYARKRTSRPLMVPLPGPYTLAGRILTGEGHPYRSREEAAWALVPFLQEEIRQLFAAGARFVQIDEPTPAIHKVQDVDIAKLFNAVVDGVRKPAEAEIWCHLCFGNFAGRPYARRDYSPVIGTIAKFKVDQVHLEFAGVEMNGIGIVAPLAEVFKRVSIGVVDVKLHQVESPAEVAARIRLALRHLPADKLALAPDCGFSQTPRSGARGKAASLAAAAGLVRAEINGSPR
ncbi:MAG: cobalamin-independent methionine synthase II family protein [Opitutaceae bacterium]|nr:cobalamin-independent methionine synthase II family protein [Opitutaceae bacterium]